MALISDKVVFALRKELPEVKIDIANQKSLMVNGKPFKSYWEGEELEKFGKLSEGYQNAILAKMVVEIKDFLFKKDSFVEKVVEEIKEVVEKVGDAVEDVAKKAKKKVAQEVKEAAETVEKIAEAVDKKAEEVAADAQKAFESVDLEEDKD